MKEFLIDNVNIITPEKIIEGGSVYIKDGVIEEIYNKSVSQKGVNVLDGEGFYLSPGFVDMHIHGGGGSDFIDGTPTAFKNIVSAHSKHGTTSFLPTILGSSFEEIIKGIEAYKTVKKDPTLSGNLLGIHLEGPYVAKSQAGALPVKYIRKPDIAEYKKIFEAAEGNLARWSIAPEIEGADELCRFLKERGVLPAIAHSEAVYEQVESAFKNGFTLITHLYSATSTITRKGGFRFAGIVESAYLIDDIDVEVIADGCHLPQSLLKFICKFKNKNRIALITDAMRASCQDTKESFLGSIDEGVPCLIEDGVAKLCDRSAFAGSLATTDLLIRTMTNLAGVSLLDAVNMVTANPIRMLNLDVKKGKIQKGYDADMVLFDGGINVKKVFLKGEEIK